MESRTIDLHQLAEDKQTDYQPDTRPSTTFRSTGREKDAHWSNRFRKDFHDLTYDVKYNLIKGKSDLNQKKNYAKDLRQSKRSRSSRRSFDKLSGTSLQKYQKRVQMIKMNKIKNPQKFNIIQKKMYSTLDTKGLCKFEFEKTIEGRLVYKSNNHLEFQHQTERSVNLNAVWYKPDHQLSPSKMFQRTRANNQSHPFSSYTERRVFEPHEQLDKFYDTSKSLRLTSARTVKQPCKIDGLIGRQPLIPPRSSSLSYNEYDAKRKLMQKICSYPIAQTRRQLKFTRQVISPQRGCYR